MYAHFILISKKQRDYFQKSFRFKCCNQNNYKKKNMSIDKENNIEYFKKNKNNYTKIML